METISLTQIVNVNSSRSYWGPKSRWGDFEWSSRPTHIELPAQTCPTEWTWDEDAPLPDEVGGFCDGITDFSSTCRIFQLGDGFFSFDSYETLFSSHDEEGHTWDEGRGDGIVTPPDTGGGGTGGGGGTPPDGGTGGGSPGGGGGPGGGTGPSVPGIGEMIIGTDFVVY